MNDNVNGKEYLIVDARNSNLIVGCYSLYGVS